MCAAAYCESYVSLFSWPNAIKNPTVHAYWTSWLKADLKKFQPKKNSRLCWKHFQDDCFDNLLPYLNGFHDKYGPTAVFGDMSDFSTTYMYNRLNIVQIISYVLPNTQLRIYLLYFIG